MPVGISRNPIVFPGGDDGRGHRNTYEMPQGPNFKFATDVFKFAWLMCSGLLCAVVYTYLNLPGFYASSIDLKFAVKGP
jgi:hypothetical protein